MEFKMPMPKGTKIWLELEAIEDLDLTEQKNLMKLVYSQENKIDGLHINSLILRDSYFNEELARKIVKVLAESGCNLNNI